MWKYDDDDDDDNDLKLFISKVFSFFFGCHKRMCALTLHTPDDAWCDGTWHWCLQLIISPCFTLRLGIRSFVFIWHNKGLLFKVRAMCVHVTAVSHINYKPNTVIFVEKSKKNTVTVAVASVFYTNRVMPTLTVSSPFLFNSHNRNVEK